MIEIVDLDEFEPTEALILYWRKMMMGRDQLDWEYDESWVAKEPAADADAIAEFRKWRDKQRGRNHPLWAIDGETCLGSVGINRFDDPSRSHCGEIGIGVTATATRQGVGGASAHGGHREGSSSEAPAT